MINLHNERRGGLFGDGLAGLCETVIKENKYFMLGTPEIILIVLVVLLLFGGKKIPELMKGLGKGVKSFKDGVNGIADEPGKEDRKKEGQGD